MLETIKKRSDFLTAQQHALSWATKNLILQKLANGSQSNKFGFTVSKKVSKLAVDRNKIKRRLRAIVRETALDKLGSGYNYVIIARAQALQADYSDLRRDFDYLLRKIDDKKA